MPVPERTGVAAAQWAELMRPLAQSREQTIAQAADVMNLGGTVVLWRGTTHPSQDTLAVQPGVADDLPSLLSSLAAEIDWPGLPAEESPHTVQKRHAVVGVWAGVWQVRAHADLRLTLFWDDAGEFHGVAALASPDGELRTLEDTAGLATLLDEVARAPRSSASPHGLLVAGNRHYQSGEYADAVQSYRRALEDLPRHAEGHRNLALALARLEQWEDASAAMAQARALAPEDAAIAHEYLALETDAGIRAVQSDDFEAAAEHFLRVLELQPDEPTALANLGNVRMRQGQHSAAIAIFRRVVRRHPSHPGMDKIRLALTELTGEDPLA